MGFYDPREADRRWLEERWQGDTTEEIMERITVKTDDGRTYIEPKKVKEYLDEQINHLNEIQARKEEWFKEIEEARKHMSSREIWGDGSHVSYNESLDYEAGMAHNNIETLQKIMIDQDTDYLIVSGTEEIIRYFGKVERIYW